LTDWLANSKYIDVPDPYYGGPDGFKIVFELVNQATQLLLKKLNFEQ